jgi:branched-chain amino acid transport system permease protein
VLQYVIAGLVLGGIYAIAAAGLTVTYLSAGILNFGFGALAFFVARFYYYLHSQQHWGIVPAGLVAILVAGPALGVFLYFLLFRFLRLSSGLIKVVATVGVSVAVPPAATLIFGNQAILKAPGLAPEPVKVFKFLGAPVTTTQIIVYCCVVAILVIGFVVLRYTDIGLRVRAMVDSPALTALSGTSPNMVSVGVWAASIGLAGLVGVLAAPAIGLDSGDFTLLMVSAFAAVLAGRLRNLPVAVVVGLLMGIAGSLIQYWLPANSSFTAAVLPSIPFIFTAVFLVYFVVRGLGVNEERGVGGALDRAIAPQSEVRQAVTAVGRSVTRAVSYRSVVVGFAVVCILPLLLHGFWVGLVGQGVAYGIIFLSFTLVVGEGGMVWLCIATFAGIGGLATAQLATMHGWPVLAAVLMGGVIAIPFGAIVGFLTIRMGNLYVAIVTLIFGLLMENLVFSRNVFFNFGLGVNVTAPSWASSARVVAYLCIAIFAVIALFVFNLRRSSSGLALTAVRNTDAGSRTTGISVLQMKVLIAAIASFVAGIGGGMLAITLQVALPADYATLGGMVWLAVLVTLGIRSNVAALFAGLSFTLSSGIALYYLPKAFGNAPPILFALGAIFVAKFPEGTLAMQARQYREIGSRFHSLGSTQRHILSTGGLVTLAFVVSWVLGVPSSWWIALVVAVVVFHAVIAWIVLKAPKAPDADLAGGNVSPPALAAAGPNGAAAAPVPHTVTGVASGSGT